MPLQNVNGNISVTSIFNNDQFNLKYCFIRHKFSVEVLIATSLFSISIHQIQNTKITTVLYTYNILENRPKAFLKIFVIDDDRLTLPRRP